MQSLCLYLDADPTSVKYLIGFLKLCISLGDDQKVCKAWRTIELQQRCKDEFNGLKVFQPCEGGTVGFSIHIQSSENETYF